MRRGRLLAPLLRDDREQAARGRWFGVSAGGGGASPQRPTELCHNRSTKPFGQNLHSGSDSEPCKSNRDVQNAEVQVRYGIYLIRRR